MLDVVLPIADACAHCEARPNLAVMKNSLSRIYRPSLLVSKDDKVSHLCDHDIEPVVNGEVAMPCVEGIGAHNAGGRDLLDAGGSNLRQDRCPGLILLLAYPR